METRQHLRFAARQLRRNPGFTAMVIITLALAIGANTVIFSLLNALMLKSLPYSHPERMGTIYTRVTGSQPSDELHGLDGEQWELMRDNVPSLISAVSSRVTSGVNLGLGSHGQYLRAGRISAHYLDVLALQPMLGRNFSEDEDRPHGPKAAILSYDPMLGTAQSCGQLTNMPSQCGDDNRRVFAGDLYERSETRVAFHQGRDVTVF